MATMVKWLAGALMLFLTCPETVFALNSCATVDVLGPQDVESRGIGVDERGTVVVVQYRESGERILLFRREGGIVPVESPMPGRWIVPLGISRSGTLAFMTRSALGTVGEEPPEEFVFQYPASLFREPQPMVGLDGPLRFTRNGALVGFQVSKSGYRGAFLRGDSLRVLPRVLRGSATESVVDAAGGWRLVRATADREVDGALTSVTKAFLSSARGSIEIRAPRRCRPGSCVASVEPNAMNGRGEVVGDLVIPSRDGVFYPHAFRWRNGSLKRLGTLRHDTGLRASSVASINRHGVAAGASTARVDEFGIPIPHGVVFPARGRLIDINTLVAPGSLEIVSASQISDGGVIAGSALTPEGREVAVRVDVSQCPRL